MLPSAFHSTHFLLPHCNKPILPFFYSLDEEVLQKSITFAYTRNTHLETAASVIAEPMDQNLPTFWITTFQHVGPGPCSGHSLSMVSYWPSDSHFMVALATSSENRKVPTARLNKVGSPCSIYWFYTPQPWTVTALLSEKAPK